MVVREIHAEYTYKEGFLSEKRRWEKGKGGLEWGDGPLGTGTM